MVLFQKGYSMWNTEKTEKIEISNEIIIINGIIYTTDYKILKNYFLRNNGYVIGNDKMYDKYFILQKGLIVVEISIEDLNILKIEEFTTDLCDLMNKKTVLIHNGDWWINQIDFNLKKIKKYHKAEVVLKEEINKSLYKVELKTKNSPSKSELEELEELEELKKIDDLTNNIN